MPLISELPTYNCRFICTRSAWVKIHVTGQDQWVLPGSASLWAQISTECKHQAMYGWIIYAETYCWKVIGSEVNQIYHVISQQMHCSDNLLVYYSSYMFRRMYVIIREPSLCVLLSCDCQMSPLVSHTSSTTPSMYVYTVSRTKHMILSWSIPVVCMIIRYMEVRQHNSCLFKKINFILTRHVLAVVIVRFCICSI
jgi:hypothetical protein